ncbi:MAG: hypothetical protein GY696_32105 [Gammaproteobacteria bacterium]|nr:hypothetical protein [Gammaproteobacteria bacterium]
MENIAAQGAKAFSGPFDPDDRANRPRPFMITWKYVPLPWEGTYNVQTFARCSAFMHAQTRTEESHACVEAFEAYYDRLLEGEVTSFRAEGESGNENSAPADFDERRKVYWEIQYLYARGKAEGPKTWTSCWMGDEYLWCSRTLRYRLRSNRVGDINSWQTVHARCY